MLSKSSLVLLVLILLQTKSLSGQKRKYKAFKPDNEMIQTIKSDCEKIKSGFLNKDLTALVEKMHPKIWELAGGKDALLKNLELENEAMGTYQVQSYEMGEPINFIIYNSVIYCIIPQRQQIQFGKDTVTTGFTIGMSENQGKTWYFIDSATMKEPAINEIFPDLKFGVKLPENFQ